MATDSKTQYSIKYAKEKLKRIPLDVQKEKYEEIKAAADEAGESVNGYIKTAIDDRMAELTEKQEQKLREYYDEKWYDDEYEEKVCLRYEEDISNAIIRLEEDAEDENDLELCSILHAIISRYLISVIRKSYSKIDAEYGNFSDQIHEFFDSYIDEFNEEMERAKEEYIEESVKEELDAMKYDIQEQALIEYFGDDEE